MFVTLYILTTMHWVNLYLHPLNHLGINYHSKLFPESPVDIKFQVKEYHYFESGRVGGPKLP